MSRYARMIGKRKYPGHRERMMAARHPAPSGGGRLVAVGTRINGQVKLKISPEILKKTEGLPWHARCARISAITGIPFARVDEVLNGN